MEREQLLEYMGFIEDMRIELADCLIPSSDFDGDKDCLRKIYGKAGELWMLLMLISGEGGFYERV